MAFSMTVRNNIPLSSVDDLEEALIRFLQSIGYVQEGYTGRDPEKKLADSVPIGIFMRCFLPDPERVWLVEEMAVELESHKTSVYRHLQKLRSMDIVEEAYREDGEGVKKKGYRIRYGNLKKAWTFTETNVEVAMRNYRATIEHIQNLAEEKEWH